MQTDRDHAAALDDIEQRNAIKSLCGSEFKLSDSFRLRIGITGDRVTNQKRFHEQVRRCQREEEARIKTDHWTMPVIRLTGMALAANRGAHTFMAKAGPPRLTHVAFVHEHDTVERTFAAPDYNHKGKRHNAITGREQLSDTEVNLDRVPPLMREPVFDFFTHEPIARVLYVQDESSRPGVWHVRTVRSQFSTSRAQMYVVRRVLNSPIAVRCTPVDEGGYDMHVTIPTILVERQ